MAKKYIDTLNHVKRPLSQGLLRHSLMLTAWEPVVPKCLIDLILGDLTPDTDSVFMEAVKGMFLSKVYDIFNH